MTRKKPDKLIVMGVITAAHGVRGEVKLKSFTAVPEDIFSYGPLLLNDGPDELEILSIRPARGQFIARLKGVDDRSAAEKLKGVQLKLPRAALPEPEEEDEFYYSDLAGLAVEDESGAHIGQIAAVQNFGAGDLLEIRPPHGQSFFIPFTRRDVPRVDIAAGKVIVNLPTNDEDEEDV
jgi:16S rRNA processing protein RimM